MSTIKESFRDSIATGNWEGIRKVYQAITGEQAPPVPVVKTEAEQIADKLNEPMPVWREPREMKTSLETIQEQEVDDDEEPALVIPDILPAQQEEDLPPTTGDDFRIEHGEQGIETNADGEIKCRRQPMNIPSKRTNRFHDDETLFADENVKKNPDDPSLGIQRVRPRQGARALIEGSADTSKTVEVVCGLCMKKETVAAALSHRYNPDPEHNTYRCNDCTSPDGRARAMRQQRENELNGSRPRRR